MYPRAKTLGLLFKDNHVLLEEQVIFTIRSVEH